MFADNPPRGRFSRRETFLALDRSLEDLARVGGLPHPTEAESIWRAIWHEETHHSTAIEGNTLTIRQVEALLEERRAVGNRELAAYLDVAGYAQAALWVYEQAVARPPEWESASKLTVTEVRRVHQLVVERQWQEVPPRDLAPQESPGGYRRHDITPFQSGMRPPPWTEVPVLVSDWIDRANRPPFTGSHLAEHLASLHAEFERIHPFRDGNGRTGRLVLNLLLVRHGYPPARITSRMRDAYLRALARSDGGDVGPLAELIARSVREMIDGVLLPALAGDHRLVPLSAINDDELSTAALTLAARRDRLRAVRRGSRWYATRRAVADYKASRRRRRS